MSSVPLNLTRDQLATFLPNLRSVIAFEQMLTQINSLIPSEITSIYESLDTLSQEVGNATSTANSVASSLERIAEALELLSTAPVVAISNVSDSANNSVCDCLGAIDNLVPPQQPVGTLGLQDSGLVNITGGSVLANLVNNQTVLLATSVALTDTAALAAGTLLNSPVAGNPTKWVTINDNGTIRSVPTW